MKTRNHWAEIRTDYEDDFFRRVDAWKTDDDNEEGEVIAQVDMLTGRIVYINPLARIDEVAQEAIRSLVDEAKKEHPYQSPSLETDKHPLPPKTEKLIGKLTAYAKQYCEPPYGRESILLRHETSYMFYSDYTLDSVEVFEKRPYHSYQEFRQEFQDKMAAYLPDDFDWDAHIGTFSYAHYA